MKNHEKPWKTMNNQPGTMKTMKNQNGTMKSHEKLSETNLEPWKTKKNQHGTMKNHENRPGTINKQKCHRQTDKQNLPIIYRYTFFTYGGIQPTSRTQLKKVIIFTFRHQQGDPSWIIQLTSRTQLEKVIIFRYTHFSSLTGGSNRPIKRKWWFFVTHTFRHWRGDTTDRLDV